MDLTWTLEPL